MLDTSGVQAVFKLRVANRPPDVQHTNLGRTPRGAWRGASVCTSPIAEENAFI